MILSINKKSKGFLFFAASLVTVGCSLFSLTGCSDTWENHYDDPQKLGTQSLMTIIDEDPQLTNFSKILKTTHLYTNDRRSSVTYADLLNADQSLTVWAPVDGSYNADSLLALCQTVKGDSGVATHFVCNHIARSLHGMNSTSNDNVRMLNDKYVPVTASNVGGSAATKTNIPAKNGLLHKLAKDAFYYYNIYDAITSLDEYAHFGTELLRFERRELNEDASVVADIINGQKIYSDSVTYKYNYLFRYFDAVNQEDSTFFMLAPSKKAWDKVYNEAKNYFCYNNLEKGDSVQSFWTTVSLLQDLFYNENIQKAPKDSLVSTSYSAYSWPYNVYYDPYGPDGIITRSNVSSVRECSNGYIMNIDSWPFDMKNLYFHPITVQGEATWNMVKYTDCSCDVASAIGDTISGNAYLNIKSKSNKNWDITYNVGGTLSGTYDVCAVVLPRTVYRKTSKDDRPNKLYGVVTYKDSVERTIEFPEPAISSGVTVDTICLGRVTLPVCNYGQKDPNLKVTIKCVLARTETDFTRDCMLDCIYMRPVNEEDMKKEEEAKQNGAKPRKETQK